MRVRTSSSSTLRRSTSSVARRSRDSSARRSWASSSSRTRASTSSSMCVRYSCSSISTRSDSRRRTRLTAMITDGEADLREVQRVEADDDPVLDDRVEQRGDGEQRGHEPEVAGADLRGAAGHAIDRVAQEREGDERERVGHVLEDVRRRLRHDHDGAAHGLHLHETALLLVEDPAGQHDVDDQREGEAGREREQEPHRPHVGDEGDEPDDRRPSRRRSPGSTPTSSPRCAGRCRGSCTGRARRARPRPPPPRRPRRRCARGRAAAGLKPTRPCVRAARMAIPAATPMSTSGRFTRPPPGQGTLTSAAADHADQPAADSVRTR